ncbi:hypothetical protein Aperf_G00000108029 [Anoplocephala perfoliata]
MKQNNEIKQINDQLRADIERLEETIYRETQQTDRLMKASELVEHRVQSLNKALEEVDRANEKMRNEKSSLLEEYHNRLNNYENSLQKNAILRDFVENWRCHVRRNKDLLVFPTVVKNLAASLEHFYSCNLADQLEGLVSNTEAEGNPSANSFPTEVEFIAAKQQATNVGSVNSPPHGVRAQTTNDDNQNNACLNFSPAAVTTQPVPLNSTQPNDHDRVKTMVIALPGPGYQIPKTGSCPPIDVANEIEALDSISSITDNSDSTWIDQRNKELRHDSPGPR